MSVLLRQRTDAAEACKIIEGMKKDGTEIQIGAVLMLAKHRLPGCGFGHGSRIVLPRGSPSHSGVEMPGWP